MTTTEPLQFSVISAPVAAIDRRTLSQAWYSALYRQTAPPQKALVKRADPGETRKERLSGGALRENAAPHTLQPARRRSERPMQPRCAAEIERRGPRCGLARKIERAFLQPHRSAKTASFRIEGVPGRVHIILREGARGLQLVAVCSRHSREYVAAALAQARYALAARGIALDARLSCEETVC